MTVYVIAQIRIHDRTRYERYAAGFMDVLVKYEGRLLSADEHPKVTQGGWPYDKVILMRFADHVHFDRWAMSPEYQAISKDRLAATEGTVIVAAGLPSRE